MSTLARWMPLRDTWRFNNDVSRLFDLATRGVSPETEALANGWAPPVDIYEDAEGVTLNVEIPGMNAADVDVRIDNSTLTLKGERKLEKEDKRDNYHRVERYYGAFSRSFTLPPTVAADKVLAHAKNGVLTIFLPKREEARPRQIKVNIS